MEKWVDVLVGSVNVEWSSGFFCIRKRRRRRWGWRGRTAPAVAGRQDKAEKKAAKAGKKAGEKKAGTNMDARTFRGQAIWVKVVVFNSLGLGSVGLSSVEVQYPSSSLRIFDWNSGGERCSIFGGLGVVLQPRYGL